MARVHLESLLRARKLDVTLTDTSVPRSPDERAPAGLPVVDAALGGGFARGQLSEIVGPRSSGRTAVLCQALAASVARGELVALIDTHDRFDPVSAGAAGLDLSRVLWVRDTGDAARALKAMTLVLQAGNFGVVAFDLADVPAPALRAFPFTTWLRIAKIVEGSQTVALIVGSEHIARSPGGVTLTLESSTREPRVQWSGRSHRSRLVAGVGPKARVVGGPSTGSGQGR
jgi:recA bacterial DNA recombination protein